MTLSQVLNNYDQETNDFFRWKVTYPQKELSTLVREKTGIDFGMITELEPVTRGTSGRIIRLRIKGDRKTMIIGKELEIRKALSKTHLYSSAFVVEKHVEGEETTLYPSRCRMGPRSGAVPDRRSGHGRLRILVQGYTYALFHERQPEKDLLK